MNALTETRARFEALCQEAAGETPPPGFAALRQASREAFLASGLPEPDQEEWRYTSLAPLHGHVFQRPDGTASLDRALVEEVATPVFACGLEVFANGRRRPALAGLPVGDVEVLPLEEAGSPLLGTLVDAKGHPFAALNGALADQGVLVRIPEGAVLDHPVHLVFVSVSPSAARISSPRVIIEAGAGSRAVVVQDHVSVDAGPHLTNAVTEVRVAANASLELAVLQREAAADLHFSNVGVRVERDARFRSHTITLGGRLVRNDLEVVLAGEGAEATLNGAFLGTDERLIDNHTLVDHAVPHGTSRELYKGILGGRSRGVFRGRVLVRPDAQKTDATQSNPNLLLADGAEIDSKPQLEIHADDVKCSHGSAIGRIDEDALFYLRARGIGETEARGLLTRGFAAEVLAELPGEALAEAIAGELAARLEDGS